MNKLSLLLLNILFFSPVVATYDIGNGTLAPFRQAMSRAIEEGNLQKVREHLERFTRENNDVQVNKYFKKGYARGVETLPVVPTGRQAQLAYPILPPLIQAVNAGQGEIVRYLLNPEFLIVNDHNNVYKNGYNALHNACLDGHVEIVRTLLDSGFSVNERSKDIFKATPLMLACGNADQNLNMLPIIQLLLEKGAFVRGKDEFGATPLHYAAANSRNDSVQIIKLLLDNGASVNDRDGQNDTPLHLAVDHNLGGNVKVLLENGALVGLKNYKGKTALNIAEEKQNIQIVEMLKAAPPDPIPDTTPEQPKGSRLFRPSEWTTQERLAGSAAAAGLGALTYYLWKKWKQRQHKMNPKPKPTAAQKGATSVPSA